MNVCINAFFLLQFQVLGMDLLPPQKFAVRQWRFGRKRRRSGTEGAESEGNFILLAQCLMYYQVQNFEVNRSNCNFH